MPSRLLDQHLVFSRRAGGPKEYVQDRMRTVAEDGDLARLVAAPGTHVFICGLKGMETGVDSALADICRLAGRDWSALKPQMRAEGRYHVETY